MQSILYCSYSYHGDLFKWPSDLVIEWDDWDDKGDSDD